MAFLSAQSSSRFIRAALAPRLPTLHVSLSLKVTIAIQNTSPLYITKQLKVTTVKLDSLLYFLSSNTRCTLIEARKTRDACIPSKWTLWRIYKETSGACCPDRFLFSVTSYTMNRISFSLCFSPCFEVFVALPSCNGKWSLSLAVVLGNLVPICLTS